MRERDINRTFSDQRELQRIATILFPKKGQHLPHSHQATAHSRTLTQPPPIMVSVHNQQTSEECGEHVRLQIDKLRKEINCMLARGGGEQQSRVTQHAYLDGINRMAKGLAISASEVREAFEQFLEYLPTRLTSQPRSYTQHYHYSLLLQHVAWYKLEKALKTPLAVGFQAIREQAQTISELQERVALIERQRQERSQRRRHLEMGRALLAWRMNGHCIAAKQQSDEYLREHGLEGQQRLSQSLLNLPLLVLMLEELGREAADISELLLLDPTGERATKFMEQGLSGISSSLETVTQRSLLQTDRSSAKFSRFQVSLGPSLTALCVRRGEILFVSSLAKSADYGHADNLCYWQSLGRSSPPSLRGGAIFYPIFDDNARCIAILRQYFYEGQLTAIDSGKLERICTFLELGANLDQRMRSISRQREYIREDYYMKMIGTVRKIEQADEESDAMKLLEEEFKAKLGVEKMAIYRIQSSPGENRQLLLRRVWGEGEDLNAIMTLAHQLLKQQRNYIYLQDRLLVYANQALFDLHLPRDRYSPANSPQNTPKQTLPIELIVNVLSKVQSLLAVKEREGKREVARVEEMRISQAKQQYEKLRNAIEEISLEFISKSNQEGYVEQINGYLNKLHTLIGSKQDSYEASAIYLQYQLGKTKKEKYWLKIGEHHASVDKIPEGMVKIHISQAATLHCEVKFQNWDKSFETIIVKTIQLFMAVYTSIKLQKNTNSYTNQVVTTEMQVCKPIPATPTRQDKKAWQTCKLQSIFYTFRQRAQEFAEKTLKCKGEVVWSKERPCSSNLEGWKNSIYRLLQNKEGATIQITGKYPLISYTDYRTLRVLTSHSLQGISEECSLVITGNKGYRSKTNVYENSFMLALPVFYHHGDGTTTTEKAIAEGLQQLKEAFLRQCQEFVDGVNLFNQQLASSAARSVIFRLEEQQLALKKTAFCAIKAKSDKQEQIRRNAYHFQKKINTVQIKMVCKSFCRVFAFSQDKLHRKRRVVYQRQSIQKLCSITNKMIYGRAFFKLEANYGRQKLAQKGLVKIESSLRNIQLQRMEWSFARLHFAISQRTNANQLILVLSSLFQQYKAIAFFKIKRVEGAQAVADPTFSQFQQCRSFAEIKSKLALVAPQFMLILQATPQKQILLHSPSANAQLVNPFTLGLTNTYQAGPDGNFLWYYSPKEGATAFQIKDRLNTLSKCLEISLKNCKKAMGSAMLHCASFKGNWIRRTKAKTLRIWALESSRLQMAERNKLNDSLYQMGIQGKTIKEKLKAQEKILRNHSIQNQELLQKQEEYRRAITANSHQISAIEQGQIKLQNSRSLYHSLHRRGVLKGIFLLWRVNSSEIGIKIIKKRFECNPHFIKVGLKTISRIFEAKRKESLSDLVWRLSQVKRAVAISPLMQKIEVLFEDRAARLVTFQSELQEQENSQQSSNRSESSQLQHSKRHFDLSRSPLQRVELSADEYLKHSNGAYRLNPKTLKFLKRMGKLEG